MCNSQTVETEVVLTNKKQVQFFILLWHKRWLLMAGRLSDFCGPKPHILCFALWCAVYVSVLVFLFFLIFFPPFPFSILSALGDLIQRPVSLRQIFCYYISMLAFLNNISRTSSPPTIIVPQNCSFVCYFLGSIRLKWVC